jgi:ATP-dependent Lhr-like helicase
LLGNTLELASLRESYSGVLVQGQAPLEEQPDGIVWHTFAGGAVNRLLAAGLEQRSSKKWVPGNLSVRCKELSMVAAREAVVALVGMEWEQVAASAVRGMARGMVSKFQPCLPEADEDRLLAERLLDLEGTRRFLGVPNTSARQRIS